MFGFPTWMIDESLSQGVSLPIADARFYAWRAKITIDHNAIRECYTCQWPL
ncbi:hypothetical protein J122_1706 [Marinobacter excellens LAMA 842]|uniref:Uncharacterized protein n=1 Tax=Marinobacter excellens LAMA 842 TaxID=1306954 RepID=A0A137SCM0_9GAMM|nr:hypothetical protein J122_1706 [Marinobacter excellens LAMA 842]